MKLIASFHPWARPSAAVASLLAAVVGAPAFSAPVAASAPAGASFSLPASDPAAAVEPAPGQPLRFRHVGDGLVVEAEVVPALPDAKPLAEGDPVEVRIRLADATTGQPLSGLYPAAWFDRTPPGLERPEENCKEKVQSFLSSSLMSAAEVDLNAFYVLALNGDPSVTVLDPLKGFGGSKLRAKVLLSSPGEDWAEALDGSRLFVSLPETGRIAVLETRRFQLEREVEVGGRPTQLLLQPDGRYLWVVDETGGVLALDAGTLAVAARFRTGGGAQELALVGDRTVFVASPAAGTVTVLDVAKLAAVRTVPVGPRPVSLAYSAASGRVYVAEAERGEIVMLDAESFEIVGRLAADPGFGPLRVAPGGRFAFAIHRQANRLYVIDTVRNRIVQRGETEPEPDQIAFSDTLVYIRHAGSETVRMVALAAAGQEGQEIPFVAFPGGQRPFGLATRSSRAAGLAQPPGEPAMMVANPADGAIYFYKEGMAAPMGSFRNYGHEPRAVRVVNRSLTEREPGVYSTSTQVSKAGVHELAIFLASPKIVQCFRFHVQEDPQAAAERRAEQPVEVTFVDAPTTAWAGANVAVRFRLSDATSGELRAGRRDIASLAFLVPGIWQDRSLAHEVEPGLYEVRFTPPEPGLYQVQVEARALGLAIQRSPSWAITVEGRGLPLELPEDETEPAAELVSSVD
jgi:YVTN family beta-propeller protein